MHFLIEKSLTPVSQRIVNNLSNTLVEFGHTFVLIDPAHLDSPEGYINYINTEEIDFCIISNSFSALGNYNAELDDFIFLKIRKPVIFIHHDDPFSICFSLEQVQAHLNAFLAIKDRSLHLCLEYSNFLDLRVIGIENTFPIFHSSEFKPQNRGRLKDQNIDTSFVGHLLAGNDGNLDLKFSYLFKADYWKRVSELDASLEASATLFAERETQDNYDKVSYFSKKFFYRAMLHKLSQNFRGEIIGRIDSDFNVNIFGGDPSYMRGGKQNPPLIQKNLRYHRATDRHSYVNEIYSNSKINLNITSLQFDTAVINRVIDVGFSGGFILTDYRDDLKKLTCVSEEISYRTIDELNSKIEYYLSHKREREEIAEQFHIDLVDKCSYPKIIEFILSKLDSMMNTNSSEPLYVDLGCGSSKPNGFIGVDVFPSSSVDIIADLNRHFPFADSSVDVVRAHDTIEHLPDRIHTMNEIWRVCKPNAVVDIRVPSTDGRGAFQDPTHVSYWNANSFKYYCVEFPPYLDLCHKYGFEGQFSLNSLESIESEEQVIHIHAILTALKNNTLSPASLENLSFGNINILILLDWRQSEELLFFKVNQLIQSLLDSHCSSKTHLFFLLNESNSQEDITLLISGIVMNLFFENDINEEAYPEINFISTLSEEDWSLILPNFSCKVVFDDVNKMPILDQVLEIAPEEISKIF